MVMPCTASSRTATAALVPALAVAPEPSSSLRVPWLTEETARSASGDAEVDRCGEHALGVGRRLGGLGVIVRSVRHGPPAFCSRLGFSRTIVHGQPPASRNAIVGPGTTRPGRIGRAGAAR